MLPLAAAVGFSRIYVGAHYPGGRAGRGDSRGRLRGGGAGGLERAVGMGWAGLVSTVVATDAVAAAAGAAGRGRRRQRGFGRTLRAWTSIGFAWAMW